MDTTSVALIGWFLSSSSFTSRLSEVWREAWVREIAARFERTVASVERRIPGGGGGRPLRPNIFALFLIALD